MKIHNFNSGPAILPQIVIEKTKQALDNFNNSNLSILEIGHRTEKFIAIIKESQNLVKRLMGIGDDYEVLFLSGGATMQFSQIPMNLLTTEKSAAYCVNGIWGKKAAEEALLFGNVTIVSNTADKNHTYIDSNFIIPDNHTYLHLTSNNTVEGTQWKVFPNSKIPLIVDMSSDIFSKKIDFSQFDLIYAGAQKNLGAAGVTLVVIKKDLLATTNHSIPLMLDYKKHSQADSVLNTPPVISIYILYETLKWIEAEGGLAEMEKRNLQKSELLYSTLDSLPLYKTYINKNDRSLMNAVFFIENKELEDLFLKECKSNGFIGVKGYRTVGGCRVSMYNALPLESIQLFCIFLKNFNFKMN